MALKSRSEKWLRKKSRSGFRGYPIATIAFYGPDNKRASKVAVGITRRQGAETGALERWYASDSDIREDVEILDEVVSFLRRHDSRSITMVDRIIGCPHEEGIDYPQGEACPECPFWAGRDRWAG